MGLRALTHKKWPPRDRRVSFPSDDNQLVTGYLEPANPWEHAKNVNTEDLISSYKASCQRHGAEPMDNLIAQLEKLDISDDDRCPELSLKNECLDPPRCEPLEELLKRVQFEKIDVESSSLDDESATILFDMLEYYQSARHLNMSNNRNIGARGWQACALMIKKTTCLEQFEARDITLTQQHMNILKRPLQLVSHLHVLKLENCGLAGRAFLILVAALKMNTGLKELHLADNGFEQEDAIQLGALLRVNNHLQLLDISNNHIKDEGVRDLMDGLVAQSGECTNGKGLSILVLWNNDLTRSSSTYFSEAIAQSRSLETLNIGKNVVGNEIFELAQEPLIKSRSLLQLGMQSTNVTCKGALLLAGIIEKNRSLQRIDLRDNNIQMEGLAALSFAMKRNPCVTQLDLDPTPWSTKPTTMDQYLDLVKEIRKYCARNEEPTSTDESTEESGSPQHRSRLSSVNSRKISLTCQTLPRSPPSVAPNSINDITTRSMLEPKRTNGGRLRSPAPSPIPSPVASPIPSPSRSRFVVSRVCENSLSSTNSSASTSPVTPSSLSSSPTRFSPLSSGVSSRFRVTVVESTSTASSSSKSVVTSANANVTIGFNYKIHRAEMSIDSDDSDSVFRSNVRSYESHNPVGQTDSCPGINIDLENTIKAAPPAGEKNPEEQPSENETKNNHEETEDLEDEASVKIKRNQVPVNVDINEATQATEKLTEVEKDTSNDGEITAGNENTINQDVSDSFGNSVNDKTDIVPSVPEITNINVISSSERVETKVNTSMKGSESLRNEIIASYDLRSKKPEQPPRQATSLERLLGLFQHPGSFFSASTYAEKTETKNPIQDRVNSMIALGDKFQQYLRDGRNPSKGTTENSESHPTLHRSVSDASRSTIKLDPVKSLSIPQLSSMQSICVQNIGSREETLKAEENERENVESTSKSNILHDETSTDEFLGDIYDETNDEQIFRISDDRMLPESLQNEKNIKDVDRKDAIDESPSADERENLVDVTDNPSLVSESKTIVYPKLKDIPEYSILETIEMNLEVRENNLSREKNLDVHVEDENKAGIKCDSSSSTTDSINDPSCKNSSHCKVTCDIISSDGGGGVNDVHTLGSTGDVHNFFTTQFNNDNNKHDDNDDGAIISSSETLKDEENLIATSAILGRAKSENEHPSNISAEYSNYNPAIVPEAVIDLQQLKTNEENTEISMTSVNRLPEFNNTENCSNEKTIVHSKDKKYDFENVEIGIIAAVNEADQTDTIEEFLPLETIVSSTVQSNQRLPVCFSGLAISSNNIFGGVDFSRDKAVSSEKDSKAIDESDLLEEQPSLQSVVDAPTNTGALKSEFAITRIAVVSVDDEDYVPASIEQVSSSLSEDSGYLGKLSVDDNRNGNTSLNDLTEIPPGNDTMIDDVAMRNSMIENIFETTNTSFNEASFKIEEEVPFVRASPESNLTPYLNVESIETRVGTPDVMSGEFSEELIFKMTDIDGATLSKEIGNAIVTKIRVSEDDTMSPMMMDCYYESGQSSNANLFIENSRNAHRNSQDSGIEETTASISEDNGLDPSNHRSENFQESLDSGIDSECSSVCARVDVGTNAQKERARDPGKLDISVAMVNEEIARFTNSVDIERILGNKEIIGVDDNPRAARIDEEINVDMNVSKAAGALGEKT
ncbi:uncharacterized protein [Venturia canescens]|uniref:uncharacterized protein isoform X2 n=1 Tax=Venturia canescens TaxID=32260 RepID=UPI001C9BF081|nr:uncharacterized protein LOC122406262 isoform X2 [Venturia canescens]